MDAGPPADQSHDRPADTPTIGEALRALRQSSRMTGQELAGRTGMSQTKVSKIERGVVRPATGDVELIATTLGAPHDVVTRLVRQAEQERRQGLGRRGGARFGGQQRDMAANEERVRYVRHFAPDTVPGLLQTSEYARAIFYALAQASLEETVNPADVPVEVPEAVAVRSMRQQVLYQPGKQFDFLLMEPALSMRITTPGHMLAQIDRIEAAARLNNVRVRIVRNGTELALPPPHNFAILDQTSVLVETLLDVVTLANATAVRLYSKVFSSFWDLADEDITPILEDYKQHYVEMATPKVNGADPQA